MSGRGKGSHGLGRKRVDRDEEKEEFREGVEGHIENFFAFVDDTPEILKVRNDSIAQEKMRGVVNKATESFEREYGVPRDQDSYDTWYALAYDIFSKRFWTTHNAGKGEDAEMHPMYEHQEKESDTERETKKRLVNRAWTIHQGKAWTSPPLAGAASQVQKSKFWTLNHQGLDDDHDVMPILWSISHGPPATRLWRSEGGGDFF